MTYLMVHHAHHYLCAIDVNEEFASGLMHECAGARRHVYGSFDNACRKTPLASFSLSKAKTLANDRCILKMSLFDLGISMYNTLILTTKSTTIYVTRASMTISRSRSSHFKNKSMFILRFYEFFSIIIKI